MNKLLLKGVAAAFCMATMFGTTACGDDDDLVNVEPPVEETQDVILEGEITSDMTLKAADNNLLRGFVYVTDGVTLTIEPGTVIDRRAWRKAHRRGYGGETDRVHFRPTESFSYLW